MCLFCKKRMVYHWGEKTIIFWACMTFLMSEILQYAGMKRCLNIIYYSVLVSKYWIFFFRITRSRNWRQNSTITFSLFIYLCRNTNFSPTVPLTDRPLTGTEYLKQNARFHQNTASYSSVRNKYIAPRDGTKRFWTAIFVNCSSSLNAIDLSHPSVNATDLSHRP